MTSTMASTQGGLGAIAFAPASHNDVRSRSMAPPCSGPGSEEPSLAAKVAFLGRPDAYPEGTGAVAAVETHWSWVFLTDRHAYKLKKPVRSRHFDFTTTQARRRNCEEELRLNRRLAADVYLQMVPLGRDRGRLSLGCAADVVEWLVKMRRLPVERTLQHLIETRRVTDTDIARLAQRLSAFYAAAPRVAMTPDGYLAAFAAGIAESRDVLSTARYGLVAEEIRRAAAAAERLFEAERPMLAARCEAGRIVDGHGDLRPEHIYLLDDGPRIVDCLEFAASLRALDPVDELSFLALECARLGDAAVGEAILARCQRDSADTVPASLVTFYTAFRALVRARLAIQHLDDGSSEAAGKWRDRATTYVRRINRLANQGR
jgi:aminoglycoside phosphotransferase family enzyme